MMTVHTAYDNEFKTTSGHHTRTLIKGQTSKHQPIDQDIGLFFQRFIQKKYYLLQRKYTNDIDKGLKPKKKL